MKRWVWVLVLAIGGCASVSDINQTPPTLSVISGKKPQEYAKCLADKLSGSRGALQVEPHKDGFRVLVPQSLSPSRLQCSTLRRVPVAAASSCTSR